MAETEGQLVAWPRNQRNPLTEGNRLHRLRVASRHRAYEIAEFCEVDRRTYLAWEQGRSPIPEMPRALLSDLYGVSVAHIMGVDVDPPFIASSR